MTQNNQSSQQTQVPSQPFIIPDFSTMNINQRIAWHVENVLARNVIKTMQEDIKEMWIYNNGEEEGYFTMDAENRLLKYGALNTDANTTAMKNNILMNLKGRTMIKRKDFDSLPGYVNLLNGVLQLSDKTLLSHDPKYNFKGVMDVVYDEDAKCPNWRQFLSAAITPRDILELQKWFGYHLIKGQPYQILMILFGAEKSGKTQVLNTLGKLVGGDKNMSAHSLQQLCDSSSHASDNIYGKLANICADMGTQKIYDVSTVKEITGGDLISASPKYRNPFEHRPDAKLSFGCNNLPQLTMNIEEDAAWWRRIKLIQFTKTIPEEERNINFFNEKILPELSGIFNWMLEGYELLIEEGFSKQDSYTLWLNTRIENNPLIDFYELFDKDPAGFVDKEFVRQAYEAWCLKNKTIPLSTTKFGIHFGRLGIGVDRKRISKGGNLTYVWTGIKLSVRTTKGYTT